MAAVEAKLPGLLPRFHELGLLGSVSLCSFVLWDVMISMYTHWDATGI